jgi:hypothetical protein
MLQHQGVAQEGVTHWLEKWVDLTYLAREKV